MTPTQQQPIIFAGASTRDFPRQHHGSSALGTCEFFRTSSREAVPAGHRLRSLLIRTRSEIFHRGGMFDVIGRSASSIVIAAALLSATLGVVRAQQRPVRPVPTMAPGTASTVVAANYAAFDLGTRFLYNSSGQGGLAD